MKKILLFIVTVSVLFILHNTGFAIDTPNPVNTPIVAPTPVSTDQGKAFDPLGVFTLASNVSKMVDNITIFFVDGVAGVIEKSMGDIWESFVNTTAIDGKWVFSTPTLVQSDWVRTLWWIMLFISIGSIGVGIGVTMLRILSGKYKGHLRTALLSFMMSAILVSFSLLIADKMIVFGNDLINSYARSTLSKEAQKPENQSVMILKNIDYKKIGFEYFDGKSLVNLSFGSNPDGSNSRGKNVHMYEQFLTKNDGGGGIILVWAMAIIACIGIFGTLRQLVIGAINGLGPLWISFTAWTGNMKPVYGYLNLHLRCIALSYVFDFTWMICMYFSNHNDYSVGGKQLFASVMFTIALAVACFLFGYWVYQAVKSPIDLAGGLVQEHAIKKLSRIYPAAGAILDKLGVGSSEDSSPESSKKSSSEKKSSDDHESPSGNPETGLKDRLSTAEQGAGKLPEVPVQTNMAQLPKETVDGNMTGTSGNGMKYDSALGRQVKIPERPSTTSYDTLNNMASGDKHTLRLEDYLKYSSQEELEDYLKYSSQEVGATRDHLQNSSNNIAGTNGGSVKQNPVSESILPPNPNQTRDVLKQASIEPVRKESTPLLNGGKVLDSINKKGGSRK